MATNKKYTIIGGAFLVAITGLAFFYFARTGEKTQK